MALDAITRHHIENMANGGSKNNGSRSTVRTIQVDIDGRPTLIPTVWGGEILSNDQAKQRAMKVGTKWPTADTHDELGKIDREIRKGFKSMTQQDARDELMMDKFTFE